MSAGTREASPPVRSGAAPAAGQRLIAPDPDLPHWREPDGTRHSYRSLRSGLEPRHGSELAEAHLHAIGRIAAAAIAASERGDHAETARLAAAAARLCGEIRGLWPPSAVEARGLSSVCRDVDAAGEPDVAG